MKLDHKNKRGFWSITNYVFNSQTMMGKMKNINAYWFLDDFYKSLHTVFLHVASAASKDIVSSKKNLYHDLWLAQTLETYTESFQNVDGVGVGAKNENNSSQVKSRNVAKI